MTEVSRPRQQALGHTALVSGPTWVSREIQVPEPGMNGDQPDHPMGHLLTARGPSGAHLHCVTYMSGHPGREALLVTDVESDPGTTSEVVSVQAGIPAGWSAAEIHLPVVSLHLLSARGWPWGGNRMDVTATQIGEKVSPGLRKDRQ